MKINFPTDVDGFLSQECPSCNQTFKVIFGEGSEEPISFCPYCGIEGQGCWWTQNQADYIASTAFNTVIKPEVDKLNKKLKKSNQDLLDVSIKYDFSGNESLPIDIEEDFNIYHFPCHGETIKAHRCNKLFCLICGREKDVKMSESKKIFLSHKSVDKSLVIDFKETLEAIGYEPWLDDDAMPAGTSLDRALLQGMKDSCGVVFFITTSFKDESFLTNEINYAMQQKRDRGDKFAIITLQFLDDKGDVGEIPELLKQYIWKCPSTNLQALKEIVRALPVCATTIDWREGTEGVVSIPAAKSRTAALSEEAKSILINAAKDDGRILIISTMSGSEIFAGNKGVFPPNATQREISFWRAGITDLVRHGLAIQIDSKGEHYSITREGYKMFDQISDARYEGEGGG